MTDRVISPDTVSYYGLWYRDDYMGNYYPVANSEYESYTDALERADVYAKYYNVAVIIMYVHPTIEHISRPPDRGPA